MFNTNLLLALAAMSISGCYSEGLEIYDLHGVVKLPAEAATRDFSRSDGTIDTVTDVRLLGPVYLGLYSSVLDGLESYPHPERGPQFIEGTPGDTYPYGGTTIGDIRYACFEFFSCKLVSGRHVDFNSIVDWFANTLENPITDAEGNFVTNGDFIRQTCYELLEVTSDEEIRVTAEDKNEDGTIDLSDLDFVEVDDGYEAEFTIWQQDWYQGMSLWGFMDAPSNVNYEFSTCNPALGFQETEYNRDFRAGLQQTDVLNQPSQYITGGDWVASEGFVWNDPEDVAEISIDFGVER